MTPLPLHSWATYREEELARATPLLESLGYTLDTHQVHTGGDRALFVGVQDVGKSGWKLVLTGSRKADGTRVVIKVTRDPIGKKEIERERACRTRLQALPFARYTFNAPPELFHIEQDGTTIVVSEFIEEERTFMEHTTPEQFFLALRTFEAQEGIQVTTSAHAQTIETSVGLVTTEYYQKGFDSFVARALSTKSAPRELATLLERARTFLRTHKTSIERYSGFLTHSDFSPQNLRIRDNQLYLLDFASMHFGNKYESWARLINFMTQHNPELEHLLTSYVRENRGEDEYVALRAMRVYKLGFLIQLWAYAADSTEGTLHDLMQERVRFWSTTLEAVLNDSTVPLETVRAFNDATQRLRSPEEKARQREILMRQELRV